jgi:hypothetical protein
MAAWMEAWSGCSPGCGVEVERGGHEDAPSQGGGVHRAPLPEGLRAEVAELLAGIVWAVVGR